MKKITFIFLLSLIFICCNKQKEKKYSKKPTYGLKRLDTINRNNLLELGNKYAFDDKFFEINKTILNKSESIKDTIGIIFAKTNIGLYYFNLFKNDSAYYCFSNAEKLSLRFKGNPHICEILQNKADLLWCQKDFLGAESNAIKSLKRAKSKNIIIYSCFITIANSLFGMNDYEHSLWYYNKALLKLDDLRKLEQFSSLKTQTHNYIAQVYLKQKLYKKVINYLNNNVNLDEIKKTDLKTYSYVINTIAYSKFKLNDRSSLLLFKEVEHIADSIKFIPTQVEVKTHFGEYYLAQNDTSKANFYLKQAQIQAHQNDIFEDELKILKLLEQANPSQELYYSNRYIALNDSLQNLERATRDKFARIEFETDEITSQNKVVSNENNLLYKRIWIIFGFALLSLIIIVLWFKNKSQKAKTRELLLKQEQKTAEEEIFQLMIDQQNKIEEGKNIEKQRISLDLHDNVMGKLSAVRLNLYYELSKEGIENNESFNNLSKQIQAVEIEIRNIAHNLNTNLFSSNASFVEIVKELFAKIENHSAIKFTLDISKEVNWDSINNDIKINLYRIIQEALQNIEKYANATSVTILIMQNKEQIILEIEDNGKGFDTSSSKKGIGIKNMKTRAIAINGIITIDSKINFGTKINLIVTV